MSASCESSYIRTKDRADEIGHTKSGKKEDMQISYTGGNHNWLRRNETELLARKLPRMAQAHIVQKSNEQQRNPK